MQRISRLQQLKERGLKAGSLSDASEEVQNVVRLSSLLIDIEIRNRLNRENYKQVVYNKSSIYRRHGGADDKI